MVYSEVLPPQGEAGFLTVGHGREAGAILVFFLSLSSATIRMAGIAKDERQRHSWTPAVVVCAAITKYSRLGNL
jgi:hypothetical protein